MKIFDLQCKINFVDVNNVVVGYDTESFFCEDFGWFIRKEIDIKMQQESEKISELESYSFNPKFFEKHEFEPEDSLDDGGGIIIFQLVSENKPDIYLHLYNIQNGYYSHGFEMKAGEKVVIEGSI